MTDTNSAISRATSLTINIGLALSILVGTWYAGGRFRDLENSDVANLVEIEAVEERLDLAAEYLGPRGLFTEALAELEKRIIELERLVAILEHRFAHLEGDA